MEEFMENDKNTNIKRNEIKDLRVKRTLENINNSFNELIFETDFEKITVKSLSEKAKINKKTFYTYYSSLDDLLLEYQEKTSSEYIEQISKYRIPEDFDKITREFFLFSEKYGEAYEKITSNEKYSYIRQRMINNVMSATWEKSGICEKIGEYRYNLLIAFVQSTTLSMYKQWITDGKKISLEEIISLTSELLIDGMKKFF